MSAIWTMGAQDLPRGLVQVASDPQASVQPLLNKAQSYEADVSAGTPSAQSNWWQRTFDPTGVEMDYNAREAAKSRAFNASEAQKQRDWEERMSNTAYHVP